MLIAAKWDPFPVGLKLKLKVSLLPPAIIALLRFVEKSMAFNPEKEVAETVRFCVPVFSTIISVLLFVPTI